MPNNSDESNLVMLALFNLHEVDRGQWHIETARHLRFFAEKIETNGLNRPARGELVNDLRKQKRGRGIIEWDENA